MDETHRRGLDSPTPKKPKPKPHRATGKKPPGGKRPGAGRPKGAANALELGEVAAIKAMKLRVPESAPPLAADIAGEAFASMVEVMRRPAWGAREKLAAARAIREEVCGPVKQQVEHSGGVHVTWGFDPMGGGGDAPADGAVDVQDGAQEAQSGAPEAEATAGAPSDGASTPTAGELSSDWMIPDGEPAKGDE